MNIPLILITYTAGLSLLGMVIYTIISKGPKEPVYKIYYMASLFTLMWCFSYLIMYLTNDYGTTVIAYRIGSAGWTLNLSMLYLLIIRLIETILERKISPVPGYCVILSSLIFFGAALSGRLFATDFIRLPDGWWEEQVLANNPWIQTFIIWALCVFLLGIVHLLFIYKRTKLRRHRRHILQIIFPLVVVAIFTMAINMIFPVSDIIFPPIGHILISFYLIFIGYGIVKYRMTKPEPEIITNPLLLQISDMVILTDNKGSILQTNHAVSNLLGYEQEDLLFKNISAILPDIMSLQEETKECEAVGVKENALPVHCAVNPIHDIHGDQIGFFLLLKDLTRLKKLEELTDNLHSSNLELERLSITDSLTGMFNRSKTEDALNLEITRSRRYGSVFSIILYDIDHFKSINDSYGHTMGDTVLRSISDTVRQSIRKTDILGRWGGEEFLIICVNSDLKAAGVLAEKIRSRLEGLDHWGIGKVTASFGVTAYMENDTPESIINRGDSAMYDAKRRGRNLTSVF